MKIIPVGAPPPQGQAESAKSAADSRARAIAMLTGAPVQDQNNITPEESSIVKGQNVPSEAPEETIEASGDPQSAETEAAPEEKPQLSSQYALLARKEKALRAKVQQQEQAIKTREAALAAREAAIAAKDQEYQSGYISKQRFKESPLDAFTEAGGDYEVLTQQLINNQTPQDPRLTAHIAKLEAKLAKLEEQATNSQKSFQDQQTQSYEAAVKQITTDVTNLVKNDDRFETIRHTGMIHEVVDLIKKVHAEDGIVLDNEEAAELVEKELEERMYKVLSKTEKLKKRLNPTVATPAKAQTQTPTQSKQSQPMKTLTNATSSTRQLSAKERAILAFKGELKS